MIEQAQVSALVLVQLLQLLQLLCSCCSCLLNHTQLLQSCGERASLGAAP